MADKSDGKVSIHIEDDIDKAQKRFETYENKVNNFDVSGLQSSMDNLNKVIASLSDKFADFPKPVEQDKSALKDLENVIKSQQGELEKLRKSHIELENKLKKQAESAKSAQTAYSQYQNQIQDNIQVMRELAIAGDKDKESFKKLAEETKKYKDVLKQADEAINKATGDLEQQKNPVDGLVSKLKGLVGAYVGIRGAQMAFSAVMQSVEAYRVQERAILSLDTTLKNAGVYTAEYSQKIQNLASEIQSYSNYGDEAVIKAVALGQSFAGQTKITDKATKAVVDFAAAMGMDLEQAFSLFGKSVGTSTNALTRYGVELQKGMTDSQKMEAIAKQLGERYEGQAKQMANANVQLKNSIGDMKEAFGGILNGYVTNWQRGMTKMVQATTGFINTIRIMKAETSSLSTSELDTRYNNNLQKIQKYEELYNKGHHEALIKRISELKAENILIEDQIRFIKQRNSANIKPIKYNDEISTVSVSANGKSGKATKKIKDQYDQLQTKVQEARRQVELMAVAHGTDSQQVQQAFTKYRDLNTQLSNINSLFDEQKQKIAAQGGAYQQLQEKISAVKTELMNMAVSGQSNTSSFVALKNQLAEYENLAKSANTAVTNTIGLDWNNTSNMIKTQLASALLTPLQEGETALDRFQNVAFSVFQNIAQEIFEKFVLEDVLTSVTNKLEGLNKSSDIFEQIGTKMQSTANSASIMSSAMTSLGVSQSVTSSILSSTSSELATSSAEYAQAATAAAKLAASLSQVAIADAADSVAKIPYVGGFLAPVAATLTGAAIAAGTAMTTSAAALGGITSKFANGGVFENGNVKAFANGGVVSQPTYFPMAGGSMGLMGEAGAEAIMPLRRAANGDLGVQAVSQPATVNVYNYTDSRIETRKRPNGDTDIFIRRVNAALASERTQSGMQRALERNNNVGLQAS